jgi:type IV pilus assembly protein PilA
MLQRLRAVREEHEGGFTLIELLVVILIIAILAAIAIPVFLSQREKAWVSQAESALKNGATAMETGAVENNGTYPTAAGDSAADTTELRAFGFRPVSGAPLDIISADSGGFCLQVDHANLTANYKYDSTDTGAGKPVTGNCA